MIGGPLARHREKGKTVILALLVGFSFILSARLWLETPGGGPPPRPRPYVAGGNMDAAATPLADVLLPRRVLMHRAGRHFVVVDPGLTVFRDAVATAAAALSAAARQGANPVTVTAAEPAGFRQAGTGIELALPAEMPAGEWLAAWSGEAAARGLPRSGLSRVPARRIALFAATDEQAVLYLEGARGWMRVSVGGGQSLMEGLDGLAAGEEAAVPAGNWRNLKVPDGLYVPTAPRFARLEAVGERLDPGKLSGSFFADPGVVRRVNGRDGSLLFTDGQQGLRIGTNGSVRFDGQQVSARKGGDTSLPAMVREALTFIADHGGWPRGMRLLAVSYSQNTARLDFAPGFEGYPLMGFWPAAPGEAEPDAASAPVSLSVAAPGGFSAYRRAVLLPSGGDDRTEAVPAAQALAAVDAAWPVLTAGDAGPGLVVDVYPAYLAGPAAGGGGPAFRPAWVVEFEGGRRVAVDAVTGRVAAGASVPEGEG